VSRRRSGALPADGVCTCPVGAIGVERHGQAVALEHGAQGGHDRGHALATLAQLGVEQLLRGVVNDGNQREPLLGHEREPVMTTPVEVQQLAEARARFASTAMAPPRLVLGHQPGGLQRLLHERIAELRAVLPAGELVEVPHVEALVAIAVELEPALDLGDGCPFRRRRLPAAIEESLIAEVLQPPPDAAHRAGVVAQDVRGLHPGQLPVDGAQEHFLHLHGTLHSRLRIGHGHLLGAHSFHGLRQERSFHGSLNSGHFTYPQ